MCSNTIGAVTLNIYRAACTVSQECMLFFLLFLGKRAFDDGHVVSTVGQGDFTVSFISVANHDRVKQDASFPSLDPEYYRNNFFLPLVFSLFFARQNMLLCTAFLFIISRSSTITFSIFAAAYLSCFQTTKDDDGNGRRDYSH